MRRLVLTLLRLAFVGHRPPAPPAPPPCAAPRGAAAAGPGAAACRRAWGEIRARYRLRGLLVPA